MDEKFFNWNSVHNSLEQISFCKVHSYVVKEVYCVEPRF
jgi:hypothetical protein